jgi:hypothetical protein
MNFFDAMTTNDTLTENFMPTHSTSGSHMLDWFFKMGGYRGQSVDTIVGHFATAFGESDELAMRSLFCLRDVRGGMGERRSFRLAARWLAQVHPEYIKANIHNIPHYGRWDDVLYVCLGTPVEDDALTFIWEALTEGDKLCAKWMPREGKSEHEIAVYLVEKFGLSRREYRKLLARNTEVVENLMCAGRWDRINFAHVPSQAFAKYRDAFARHQPDRFNAFLERVESGEEDVHAGAIHPHEIARKLLGYATPSTVRAMNAQWKSLPRQDTPDGTLVVADVSASMNTGDGVPMQVSVSLALYFAEQLQGPFENVVVTFSEKPKFFRVPSGTLEEKMCAIRDMNWDMNTNLEAVFDLMLMRAKRAELADEEMPKNILIISDMQFDRCIEDGDKNALEMMRSQYKEAGYTFPQVIFWNVRSSSGIPAKMSESGVGLLSGFSPSLMQAVMNGVADPQSVMENTLMDERYDKVVVPS